MRSLLLLSVTVALIGCAPSGPPVPGKANGQPPPNLAATPEDAVRQLELVHHGGDFDLFLAVLARADRELYLRLKQATQDRERACDAFFDALQEKFGPQQVARRCEKVDFARHLRDAGARFEVIAKEPREDDSTVKLTLRVTRTAGTQGVPLTQPEVWIAIQEEGGWKLSQGPGFGEGLIRSREEEGRLYQRMTERVRAGEFRTLQEALQTLQEAQTRDWITGF